MQQSQVAQPWSNIASGSPLIRVEHVSLVIDSRTHKTVILDTIDFTIPAHTLYYTETWNLSIAKCRDQVYAEVASNLDSDGYDYYVVDTRTYDFSRTEYWPIADGSTGECIVENPNNKSQYPNFTNFNYIAFTNCDINSTGINSLSHNYYNMWNGSHELAYTGPITGNGNYNVTWHAPN